MSELNIKLNDQYNQIISGAKKQAEWYSKNKKAKQRFSKIIRFSSILLIGAGGIFPLIGNSMGQGTNVSNWGFICIALAGTLLFLDRFFGFSSGWIRYILTEMDIYKQVNEFELRWKVETSVIETCGPELTCARYIELLNLLKDFSTQIDTLVRQETTVWATEFQSNISELQKMAASKTEELRPGSIKIIVKNRAAYPEIKIKVDGVEKKVLTGNEALIDNIAPGSHEVILCGKNSANESKEASAVVTVEPGKMASIEITMP